MPPIATSGSGACHALHLDGRSEQNVSPRSSLARSAEYVAIVAGGTTSSVRLFCAGDEALLGGGPKRTSSG
jgi:hypothetical protein